MSDIHIIGTLSREDTIEEAALYYLRLGYSVSMVRKQPNENKENLIMYCFKNIEDSTRIVAIPHKDGTCGEGTQYEIAYAKFLGKRVEPSRNECGEIDECIGCNIEDCYDIHGDGTNKKCKWKNLIDKEAEEIKDDN